MACPCGSTTAPWGWKNNLQPGVDTMEKLAQTLDLDHVVKVHEGAKHFESDWGIRMPEALGSMESAWTRD